VAELESTEHCLDRAICTPILATGRQPYSKKGRRILETAGAVAAGATGGRRLVRLRRRLLQARAPPSAVCLMDLLAGAVGKTIAGASRSVLVQLERAVVAGRAGELANAESERRIKVRLGDSRRPCCRAARDGTRRR
jgi:hypothetical protein